jgi:hypothetical protein
MACKKPVVATRSAAFSEIIVCTIANFALAILAMFLFVVGCISAKRWQFALALIFPFILTLLASALQRYPFADRLMLSSIPILIMLIVEESNEHARHLRKAVLVDYCTSELTALLLFKPMSIAWRHFYRLLSGRFLT